MQFTSTNYNVLLVCWQNPGLLQQLPTTDRCRAKTETPDGKSYIFPIVLDVQEHQEPNLCHLNFTSASFGRLKTVVCLHFQTNTTPTEVEHNSLWWCHGHHGNYSHGPPLSLHPLWCFKSLSEWKCHSVCLSRYYMLLQTYRQGYMQGAEMLQPLSSTNTSHRWFSLFYLRLPSKRRGERQQLFGMHLSVDL